MIDLSQELIFSLILRSFMIGALLGLLYEAIRVMRLIMDGTRKALMRRMILTAFVFFTDLWFCLTFASSALLLTYNISGGVFRGSVYLSMGLGLLIYRLTLGKLFHIAEALAVKLVKKVVKTVLKLLLAPIWAIFSLFIKIYGLTIGKIIGKIRCRVIQIFEEKKKSQKDETAVALMPPAEPKEDNNAEGHERYRKECRISFGGRRST